MILRIILSVNRNAPPVCGNRLRTATSGSGLSAADAARRGAVGERLPQQLIFRRGREDRVVLTAEAALELGLGEQSADFGLAARCKQRQPVERAGKGCGLNEFAALTEPTGDLQQRIVMGAHKAE